MPQYRSGGVQRLIFTGNVKTNLFNAYTPGSGVGALNTSVRRALQRKATLTAGSIENMNTRRPGCGQCNTIVGANSASSSGSNSGASSNTKSNNNVNKIDPANNVDPVIPVIAPFT